MTENLQGIVAKIPMYFRNTKYELLVLKFFKHFLNIINPNTFTHFLMEFPVIFSGTRKSENHSGQNGFLAIAGVLPLAKLSWSSSNYQVGPLSWVWHYLKVVSLCTSLIFRFYSL